MKTASLKDNWKLWWVVSYAIGLVLIPPIHFHGRLLFSAEWLLIPLFVALAGVVLRGEILSPTRELLFVWCAAFLAFIAGSFRGDLARQISIYDLKEFRFFSFKDDGIVFVRSIIIFSTPWFLRNILRNDREKYLKIFMTAFKISILISAILAILDYQSIGLLNLRNWGYTSATYDFWAYRAQGTFFTPIEASFVYGLAAVYLLTGPEPLRSQDGTGRPLWGKSYFNLVVLCFALVAMILTHGGTAMGALLICIFLYFVRGRVNKKNISIGIVASLVVISFAGLVLPHDFFTRKVMDFNYRIATYRNWIKILPSHPLVLLIGLGFSRICSDNNVILLVIQGGIIFLGAVSNWVWLLIRKIPRELRFMFLFWALTWMSFDTLSFWGIGRICWFLLGLVYA